MMSNKEVSQCKIKRSALITVCIQVLLIICACLPAWSWPYSAGDPLTFHISASTDQTIWTNDTIYVGVGKPVYLKAVNESNQLISSDIDYDYGSGNVSDITSIRMYYGYDMTAYVGNQQQHTFTQPGTYTVTATNIDNGTYYNDADAYDWITVKVVRLDAINLYFSAGNGQAYPYTTTALKTRAVILATIDDQRAYCGMDVDEGLTWWKTGYEGASQGSSPSPNYPTGQKYTGTVDPLPNNWPSMTITWQLWKHQATDADGNHDRTFSYTTESYLTGWGEDSRYYSEPGIHRLVATTTLDTTKTSTSGEYAIRICVKDPDIYETPNPVPPNTEQRRAYLEWLSTYLKEPYEWGGSSYGGKTGFGGGDNSDGGYGIDCSGLVSCGAYRAGGYAWNPWHRYTSNLGLVSSQVTSPWSDNILPGDIFLYPGVHVRTYIITIPRGGNSVYHCIESTVDLPDGRNGVVVCNYSATDLSSYVARKLN